MNILSISTCSLDPCLGSGKTRLRWSTGLRALGHSVDMIEPKEYETWHGLGRAIRFRQAWGACRFVHQKLRSMRYDVIEFFGGEFGLITWQLARRADRPLIVAHTDGLELLATERERAYDPPTSILARFRNWYSRQTHERLDRAAFVHADAFVTGCELDRKYVLDRRIYPPDRTAVIEPCLDAEYLSRPYSPSKQHRIAYMGSWIPRKGITRFTEVMTRVLQANPEVHCDIFGTGGKRDAVLSGFAPALHQRITVHGRIAASEVAEKLAQAKVFFFPTQYEGFGMALAEAMACGCAAVTTPTGFGAELRHNDNALVCDFNDLAGMEAAILQLLRNEDLRARIARAGWERVRALDWETNVRQLESVYLRWSAEHEARRNNGKVHVPG